MRFVSRAGHQRYNQRCDQRYGQRTIARSNVFHTTARTTNGSPFIFFHTTASEGVLLCRKPLAAKLSRVTSSRESAPSGGGEGGKRQADVLDQPADCTCSRPGERRNRVRHDSDITLSMDDLRNEFKRKGSTSNHELKLPISNQKPVGSRWKFEIMFS